jgi:hypothetical protein
MITSLPYIKFNAKEGYVHHFNPETRVLASFFFWKNLVELKKASKPNPQKQFFRKFNREKNHINKTEKIKP